MEPRQQRAAWAAATVAGVLVAFAPAVVGLRTLSRHDTDRLYAPVRTLVVEELRGGRLPLWNPYEGTGKPLFAEGIHSVLHPVSLLGAALAPSSIDFLILGYLIAAALGAFVLAWAVGTSAPASAGAGLAFALSGYSASMTGNLVFLAGLSTLPWVIAAARSAGEGARWGAVYTALATACAFFSGDVQVALVGLALGLVLAADAGGRRGAARALAGMGAGLLLGAVQILATREILPRTYRSVELPQWEKTRWAFAPWRLVELVLPGLSRGPLSAMPARTSGEWIDFEFAESVYLGGPLVVAAGLALSRRGPALHRRTTVVLGAAGLVLVWLAFGHRLGARQLLDWVPVWNQFRYTEKLIAPFTLCASLLAAFGVDALGAEGIPRVWKRGLAAAAAAAGTILVVLLVAPDATQYLANRLVGDAGPFYRANVAAGLPHLVVGLGALLTVDRLRRRASALALLVALAPAAAVHYGAHLAPFPEHRFDPPLRLDSDSPSPRVTQPATPLFDIRESQAYFDTYAVNEPVLLFPSYNVAYRVETLGTYGAFDPRRLRTLLASLDLTPGPMSRDVVLAGVAGHQGHAAPEKTSARSLQRFALTHLLFPSPRDEAAREFVAPLIEGGRLARRDEALRIEFWALPHRPWAFFPSRALAEDRPSDAHRVLLDLIARGEDDTVVVEAREAPSTAPGRVLHFERTTRSLAIEAESVGPALIVVQDAWWPGWRASIDGKPAEILIADILVRAVRWPPSRHRLEMVYNPPGLRLGLTLSAAGVIAVLMLAILAARRRRAAAPG